MIYKILADAIMVMHLIIITFMLWGFALTLRGFFHRDFFNRWIFRTVHLCGIFYISSLAILGDYCPLTIWESNLMKMYNPELKHTGSFIVRHIENLVYPNVNPLVITIPTIMIGLFTLVVYVFKPPAKIRNLVIKK